MRGSTWLITATLLSTVALAQSPSTDSQFKRLDRNGDGKLTRDEIPRLFDQLDADRDGVVTPAEAAAYRGGRRGREAGGPGADAAGGVELVRSRDIRYATTEGVDAKSHSLDIYAPKGARDLPVIVMIHGGGWRGGDKGNRPVGEDLAQKYCPEGFVLVSVNYRLTPAGKHPANIQDVAQAVAWVNDHIADRGGDPKQMFVMGHSAGAHLAALVAADDRWLKAEGKPLSILKGAVLLDTAAYDIPRYMKEFAESRPGSGMRRLYENAFGDTEEAWRDASPQARVAKGKGIPPMLMFYTGRRMAANALAPAFVEALAGAGVKAAAIDTVTLEHNEILTTAPEKDHPLARMVLRFLKGEDPTKLPARLPAAGEGQPHPEDAVTPTQTRPLPRHLENGKLLAEGQILGDQGGARKPDSAKDTENQPDHVHSSASVRVL